MDVRESYDSAADAYARHLAAELDRKPLDRHLLNRFAEATAGLGPVADLGCGPGHVAAYLHARHVSVVGIDLSPEMIKCAASLNPGIEFRTGDMRALDWPAESLAGLIAFYAIVHFSTADLGAVFTEMRRVLRKDGLALLAFHIGEQVVHVDDLFGARVSLDFVFHSPDAVVDALRISGFKMLERTDREPYEGAEYPSRRCYLLVKAV